MNLDRELLAKRVPVIEMHLARVAEQLPSGPESLLPMTDASDSVILHLWQATQVVFDLAALACLRFHLGTPQSYSAVFSRLAEAGYLKSEVAAHLSQAADLHHAIAHAYKSLDMERVYRTARDGPADLRAFLAALQERIS